MNKTHDEDELLRRMRAGDREAFAALYRRHADAVYRYALMRSGSPHTAADAVQDCFLLLLAPACSFDPLKGCLQAYLFGVARKLILKRDAQHWRHDSLDDDGDDERPAAPEARAEGADPQERLLADEDAETVRRALQTLAPHYRDVLVLYELHELSYVEIAQVCGVDIGTVRSRLSRARDKLARALSAAGLGAAQAA